MLLKIGSHPLYISMGASQYNQNIIKKIARKYFYQYKSVFSKASIYDVDDLIQEGSLYLIEKNLLESSEKDITYQLHWKYRDMLRIIRDRGDIYQEIPYNELSEDEQARFDNEAYAITGEGED